MYTFKLFFQLLLHDSAGWNQGYRTDTQYKRDWLRHELTRYLDRKEIRVSGRYETGNEILYFQPKGEHDVLD